MTVLFWRKFVFVGADVVVAETAALQFHDRPLQLAVALTLQHRRRQIPIGRFGQGGGDLFAGSAMLLVFQLACQVDR